MFNLEHKIPPPVVGLACAGLAWLLAGAAPALALPWSARLALAVALLLALAGLALELWGLSVFRCHRTTPNPLAPERARAVVQSGPYRFTRNPMYVGVALQLLGWCAYLRNPLALLALILYPLVWLVCLPFRLVGIVVEGVFEFLRAIILLPARIIGGKPLMPRN